jgi:hypothetical protein
VSLFFLVRQGTSSDPILKCRSVGPFHVAINLFKPSVNPGPPLWSELLTTAPKVPGSIPALPDFLRSKGSGTGPTQPREYN